MTDYTKLDGPGLLYACGTDAGKWAKAFCQRNPDANVGEDVMLGWFANAIMQTHDTLTCTVINGEHAQYLLDNNLSPCAATA